MKFCFQNIERKITTKLALFLALFLVANGCEKHERIAAVRTDGVTELSYTSCYVTGNVLDLGDAGIDQHGFVWSLNESPTTKDATRNLGSIASLGTFGDTLKGLTSGAQYYFRAYALNDVGEYYGKQVSFTTLAFQLPVVTTSKPESISTTTLKVGGNVTDDGGDAVTERGVYYSTSAGAETTGTKKVIGSGTGEFFTSLTGLTAGTTYFVKAYATNSTGTAYGSEVSFTTETEIVVPILTTAAVTAVTETTAQSGGDISDDGGAAVAERGVCWSTNQNPTTADNTTSDGTGGTGSFTSSIGGLTSNTTYYVRAYASNSAGTAYGNQQSFATTVAVVAPTVSTATVTDILTTSAIVGGNVTDDGGDAGTERGVYYSTSPEAETSGTKEVIGSGSGEFSTSLTGLTAGTTYYMKAYATNSAGTAYGSEVSFTTGAEIVVPTLTTTAVTAVTESTAESGGDISDDGGAAVTERGVCWSTNQNPTTADNNTSDGTGTGSFTSSISGLTSNTTYYVRAYATNSAGTGYGQEISFTTDGPVTDYDDNTYTTVRLGNQLWMEENLKVTHYPDGSAIPLVTDNTVWANLGDNNTDDAYCYYNNNSSSEYGALYTYAAALNVCPAGWHLPSDAEWTELENYLADNGYNYDGTTGGGRDKIAKAMATASGWSSSSTTGAVGNSDYPAKRNASGFTALPEGARLSDGTFYGDGGNGLWWSSTEYNSTYAYFRYLYYNTAYVYRGNDYKSYGYSVRCVRDD